MLGLGNQPGHRDAKVDHLLLLGALAFAAANDRAFAEQALEGLAGFAERSVIAAMHKVLRDHAALDVAVQPAADAQQVLVGAHIELRFHRGVDQRGLQLQCAGFRRARRVEVQRQAVGDRAQAVDVHPVAQPVHHMGGQHVLGGQRLKLGAAQRRSEGLAG